MSDSRSDLDVLWTPPADALETTRVGKYIQWLKPNRGLEFDSYEDLHEWSVTDLAGFWSSIWEYFEINASVPYDEILTSDPMPDTRWFTGARLNYAERMLSFTGDRTALFARSATRDPFEVSFDQLREQVARVRTGLRRLGVGRGDAVVAYLPNIPETVVTFLAAASLGATFASCAPEFGVRSVLDRFRQIEPKVLFVVDGYHHKDKVVSRQAENEAIRAGLPSLEVVVGLPYVEPQRPVDGTLPWAELVAEAGPLEFEQVPADHPLYVLYSSGTTGIPKPLIHGHGRILVEHLKGLNLHMELGEGDILLQPATTAWMVWNYSISALGLGASMVCFDGDVTWPDFGRLWELAEDVRATSMTSASAVVMGAAKAGIRPGVQFDLSALRYINPTGSPLPPEGFLWIYDAVKRDLLLAPGSGGTDVCSAFVGGTSLKPVVAGEMACRYLGAAVDAYDDAGQSVRNDLGELVITKPMPSMPVGLWGDPDKVRYRASYFDMYPGVWRHGDWIIVTDRGTCIITGRSDSTLNRGGVRLGTSEFYAVVDAMPEVADSVVVHIEDSAGGSGELVLIAVPKPGTPADDELRRRISKALKNELSPRHIPDTIEFVTALPHTLTGKKLEVPIKKLLLGADPAQVVARDAVTNPDSLNHITRLARTPMSRPGSAVRGQS